MVGDISVVSAINGRVTTTIVKRLCGIISSRRGSRPSGISIVLDVDRQQKELIYYCVWIVKTCRSAVLEGRVGRMLSTTGTILSAARRTIGVTISLGPHHTSRVVLSIWQERDPTYCSVALGPSYWSTEINVGNRDCETIVHIVLDIFCQ